MIYILISKTFFFTGQWYYYPGIIGHYVSFFAGLFFMIIYYVYFHPTGIGKGLWLVSTQLSSQFKKASEINLFASQNSIWINLYFPPFYIEVEFFNIKRGSYHNQNNITPSELLDTENQPIIGEKHFLEKNRSSITPK